MRGEKLFKILEDKRPEKRPTTRGRNAEMANRRDRAIIARYYYHTTLCQCRFDQAIGSVEKEFFLSQERIITVLKLNVDHVKALKDQKVTVSELQRTYPHYKW